MHTSSNSMYFVRAAAVHTKSKKEKVYDLECALIVHFPSLALTLSDFLPHLFHIFLVSTALFVVSLHLHLVPRLCFSPHSWSVRLFCHVWLLCPPCSCLLVLLWFVLLFIYCIFSIRCSWFCLLYFGCQLFCYVFVFCISWTLVYKCIYCFLFIYLPVSLCLALFSGPCSYQTFAINLLCWHPGRVQGRQIPQKISPSDVMWVLTTNITHNVITMLCLKNLYLEVNLYVMLWYYPLTEVT